MTEPTDKQLPDDEQLDQYLKGDSSVSRQYRQLSSAAVPASLDRLVLRQAEDAVKRPSRPSWVRWTAPLAVAASAVLVVSIVVQTGLRDETLVSSPKMQSERAEAPVETKLIEEDSEQGVDAPAASADASHAVQLDMPAPPPAAPAVAPQMAARSRSVPAPVSPPAELREAQAFPGDIVAYEAAKAALVEEAAVRAQRKSERPAVREVAGPRNSVERPEPVVELSYSSPVSTAAVDNVATLQRTYSDPEAWLKDIRQLRKDNKPEEANREWRRFLAAFPNHEVAETDLAREAKK